MARAGLGHANLRSPVPPLTSYLESPAPMDELLLALRCGRISFDLFERRTRPVWTALAENLLRRWRGPVAVSVDDMRQELMLGAWIFVAHWDPKRLGPDGQPVAIGRFVTFNACDKAKKWLHQQRNAYRRDDKSPSRVERNFSSYRRSGDEEGQVEEQLLQKVSTASSAEELLLRREALVAASDRAPLEHRPAMLALAQTGDLDLAAERLAQSPIAYAVHNIRSEADARRAVVRAIQAVA